MRGADGHHSQDRSAKGVILARAVLTIAREDAPGPVVRAILPQGPHAPGARSAPAYERVGGWVSPPGDSFCWRGRLGWGGPGGETKAGEARHALCHHDHRRPGGRGVLNQDRDVARGALTIFALPRDA